MDGSRILVTGDRRWYCLSLAERVVKRLIARYGSGLTLVLGGARGVDAAFEDAGHLAGVPIDLHRADWEKYGRAAGPIRNQEMIDSGATLAIALHPDLAG